MIASHARKASRSFVAASLRGSTYKRMEFSGALDAFNSASIRLASASSEMASASMLFLSDLCISISPSQAGSTPTPAYRKIIPP
jgi:hypothetical protein